MRRRPGGLRLRAMTPVLTLGLGLSYACGGGREAGEVASAEVERRLVGLEARLGETVEHRLSPDECHILELDLEADQSVDLSIEQLGIDVATTLVRPDGGEAVVFDAPIGPSGTEGATLVSMAAGLHRLEVCPPGSATAGGRYRLLVTRPRPAGLADRSHAAGFVEYSRGLGAHARDPERATAAYAEALSRFREAGAERPQAWASYKLGDLAKAAGRAEEARGHFREAARIHGSLGERHREAVVLSHLARTMSMEARLDEARATYRRSLEIAEELGDRELLADMLENVAPLEEQLGLTLQSIASLNRRRELAVEAGDRAAEWAALNEVGEVYLRSGDRERALPIFRQGIAIARRHGLEAGVTTGLENLGRVHLEAEEAERAVGYFEEALIRRRSEGDSLGLIQTLNNLGRCYRRLGRPEEARERFAEALGHFADWEEPGYEYLEAVIRLNETRLAMEAGDFETPLASCERALAVFREFGRPALTTGASACLARIHGARGDLEQALSYIRETVEIVETFRNRSALEELRAYYLASRYEYYELYIDLLLRLEAREPGRGHAVEAFEVAERSKARTLLDNLAGTEAEIEHRADPDLVARAGKLAAEMSRLELDLLQAREGGVDAATGPAVEVLRARLRAAEREHALVTGRIFAAFPGWANVLDSRPSALPEIQAELLSDGETQLVSYLLGEQRSYVWVVGRESLHVETLPGKAEIEAVARQAARLLALSDQPNLEVQAELAARELSRLVLAQVLPRLSARRLLLVQDGALHYVPFAALPLPTGSDGWAEEPVPLVERFELIQVPSASAALALRRRAAPERSYRGEVAMLADPVFERDDERFREDGAAPGFAAAGHQALTRTVRGLGLGELVRLPGSREEARRVSELLPASRLFLATGFEANREALVGGRTNGYRILHLVGHGLAHPDLTGLVLSLYDRDGRAVDGLVRAHEIYGLDLDAELVILSACRTGIGPEVRGEGLMGLSRSFLYAGASQVLASLWDVDDQATAELMERFYAALLRDGERPVQALRTAQRALRRDPRWAAAHYWGGFVLQGEAR